MNRFALATAAAALAGGIVSADAMSQTPIEPGGRYPRQVHLGEWRVGGKAHSKGMPRRVEGNVIGGVFGFVFQKTAKCHGQTVRVLLTGRIMYFSEASKSVPAKLSKGFVLPSSDRSGYRTKIMVGTITLCESDEYVEKCRGGKGGGTYTAPFMAFYEGKSLHYHGLIKGSYLSEYHDLHRNKAGKYWCERNPSGDSTKSFYLQRMTWWLD